MSRLWAVLVILALGCSWSRPGPGRPRMPLDPSRAVLLEIWPGAYLGWIKEVAECYRLPEPPWQKIRIWIVPPEAWHVSTLAGLWGGPWGRPWDLFVHEDSWLTPTVLRHEALHLLTQNVGDPLWFRDPRCYRLVNFPGQWSH